MFDTGLDEASIQVVLNDIQILRMNSIIKRWTQACLHELLDRTSFGPATFSWKDAISTLST